MTLSRRSFAQLGAAATAFLVAGGALSSSATANAKGCGVGRASKAALTGPYIDLTTPMGNVLAYARINGDINPDATSYSWYAGRVTGQRPGEAARDLMGIIGMGTVRMLPLKDRPGFQMLRKELGYFTDLATGNVLDEWVNPYLGERVAVDHIVNPAINAEIKPTVGEIGLYTEANARAAQPFILPWLQVGDRLITERSANLWVRNPLDPAVWGRESSGPMIAISDNNSFNVALADMQNPKLTKVPSYGHWVHRRPWQPWMFMGQAEGFLAYDCTTGSAACLTDIPRKIVALAHDRHPDFLVAPTEVTKAESSLARYIRTHKPAPAKPVAP